MAPDGFAKVLRFLRLRCFLKFGTVGAAEMKWLSCEVLFPAEDSVASYLTRQAARNHLDLQGETTVSSGLRRHQDLRGIHSYKHIHKNDNQS